MYYQAIQASFCPGRNFSLCPGMREEASYNFKQGMTTVCGVRERTINYAM